MLERLLQWDRDLFVQLNNLGVERYDGFWTLVTHIATWIPLYLFFFWLLFLKFPRKEALYKTITVLCLVVFVLSITHWTKIHVERLRPNNTEEINTLIRILKSPSGYSFFSGHASFSFSVTTLMLLFLRKVYKWAILFLIWPLLFAMSRIFVGVHFPLDLLVGALVGMMSGYLFYRRYGLFIAPYSRSGHP